MLSLKDKNLLFEKNRLLLLTSDVRTLVQSGPDQSELYEVCCDGAVCKHRCYLLLL